MLYLLGDKTQFQAPMMRSSETKCQ